MLHGLIQVRCFWGFLHTPIRGVFCMASERADNAAIASKPLGKLS
jgi:hypothetical protein